jgi:AhpD family alkylhydroperoxidase
MTARIDYKAVAPEGYRAMAGLSRFVHESGLDANLNHLVKLRVSQINGCAYCCWLHAKDFRQAGEPAVRLDCLAAWREAPYYTARERAALAWAESLTLIADTHAPDTVYDEVRAHFSETELVALTYLIVEINAWNRLAIPFRQMPPAA